jgi:hypothetical protein
MKAILITKCDCTRLLNVNAAYQYLRISLQDDGIKYISDFESVELCSEYRAFSLESRLVNLLIYKEQ